MFVTSDRAKWFWTFANICISQRKLLDVHEYSQHTRTNVSQVYLVASKRRSPLLHRGYRDENTNTFRNHWNVNEDHQKHVPCNSLSQYRYHESLCWEVKNLWKIRPSRFSKWMKWLFLHIIFFFMGIITSTWLIKLKNHSLNQYRI